MLNDQPKTTLEVVVPDRMIYEAQVDMAIIPGEMGEMGALPRHAPTLTALGSGVVKAYEGNQVIRKLFVSGGTAEIVEDRVTVLADEALELDEIKVEDLRAERTQLEGNLKTDGSTEVYERLKLIEAMLAAADSSD